MKNSKLRAAIASVEVAADELQHEICRELLDVFGPGYDYDVTTQEIAEAFAEAFDNARQCLDAIKEERKHIAGRMQR